MGKGSSNSCAALTFALIGFIIAAAAFVMVVILWTSPKLVTDLSAAIGGGPAVSDGSKGGDGSKAPGDGGATTDGKPAMDQSAGGKTYLFNAGPGWAPYDVVGDDGKASGLSMDIVSEVCKIAGKHCRFVLLPYTACWDSQTGTGVALQNKWVDACQAYVQTPARSNVFKFDSAWWKAPYANFYVKQGSGITSHTGRKIVFISGWYTDAMCLARNGVTIPEGDRVYAVSVAEALTKIDNNEAEVLFTGDADVAGLLLQKLHGGSVHNFQCGLNDGGGLMMRKDSTIPSWFAPAFAILKESGQLKEMCDGAQAKYGVEATCV